MNVSLGPLEEFVREKVARGEYKSDSEVLCDGLRLLKQREEKWAAEVSRKIDEGLASLEAGEVVSAEEMKAELDALLHQLEQEHDRR